MTRNALALTALTLAALAFMAPGAQAANFPGYHGDDGADNVDDFAAWCLAQGADCAIEPSPTWMGCTGGTPNLCFRCVTDIGCYVVYCAAWAVTGNPVRCVV